LNSILPLLIMPILTAHLTQTDYGIVGTAASLTQIFAIFIAANAYGLFARSCFDEDPESLRNLVSTGVVMNLCIAGSLLIPSLVFGRSIERWTQFPAAWLPLVILIATGTVIQTNYLAIIQARGEPGRYIMIQTIAGITNVGLSLYFVVGCQMDWRGRMLALALSQALVTLTCLRGLVFRLWLLLPRFRHDSYRQITSFGIPLIPHVLGGWAMAMGTRFYLNHFASVADTGLYSVAFTLTSPLALVLGSANNAFVPTLYQILSNREHLDKLRLCRVLLAVALCMPFFALLSAFAIRVVLPYIVDKSFAGTTEYIGWMAATYAAQGVYFIFGNFVVYSKRTSLMAWRADFLGGIVVLVTCPFLLRWNGPIGAAQSSFLGVVASTLGCITAAREAYPMPWAQAFRTLIRLSPVAKAAT
jgi:O-antigen/teichoic acid export membrane protein